MVKYSRQPAEPAKSAKCRISDLRAHYKNTYEVARACKGLKLKAAIRYMEMCLEHRQVIPFRKYSGGVGRTAQAKAFKHTQGRWPEKSLKAVRELLINLRANAETAKLDTDACVINHVVVQRAVQGRRRTYRAHGRISPYLSSNCHVEFQCYQKVKDVAKADKPALRMTKKQMAVKRLAIGGK
jgi:large subunit ribosomal protein L17e